MCGRRKKRFLLFPLIALAFMALASWIVMLLWNEILPAAMDGVHSITYWHAAGLLILGRLLFGRMGPGGGFKGRHGGGHPAWREKWKNMSEEEKKEMKEKWKQRFGNTKEE